jgi:hypothetical protein
VSFGMRPERSGRIAKPMSFRKRNQMDDGVRERLAEELAAKRINWKEASRNTRGPNGEIIGDTYVRDAIMRGRGKLEEIEWVCNGNKLDWPYVKGAAAPDSFPAEIPNGSLEQDLRALLAERRDLVARKRALDERIIAITELLHGGGS